MKLKTLLEDFKVEKGLVARTSTYLNERGGENTNKSAFCASFQ